MHQNKVCITDQSYTSPLWVTIGYNHGLLLSRSDVKPHDSMKISHRSVALEVWCGASTQHPRLCFKTCIAVPPGSQTVPCTVVRHRCRDARRDAALFSPEAAARTVDELHPRLWVHREVQEQTHHLTVRQDTRLSRACVRTHTHTDTTHTHHTRKTHRKKHTHT